MTEALPFVPAVSHHEGRLGTMEGRFRVPKGDKVLRFFDDIFSRQSGVVDANATKRIEGCKAFATETFVRIIFRGTFTESQPYIRGEEESDADLRILL